MFTSLHCIAAALLYAPAAPSLAQNAAEATQQSIALQTSADAAQFGGGGGLGFGNAYGATAQSFQNELEKRIEAINSRMQEAKAKLADWEKKYRAGAIPSADVEAMQRELNREARELEQANGLLGWVRKLNKPVSFECSGASLSSVANALSRVSGTPIQIEENLKSSVALKMATTRIPLYKALEAIAAQADIALDRTEEGVILRRWPSIEINGVKQTVEKVSPWSPAWDELPFLKPGLSTNGTLDSTYQQVLANINLKKSQQAAKNYPYTPLGASFNAPVGGGMEMQANQIGGVIVTLRGNNEIVLTEPANFKGKTGYWISIYRSNGKSLDLLQSSFAVSARSRTNERK